MSEYPALWDDPANPARYLGSPATNEPRLIRVSTMPWSRNSATARRAVKREISYSSISVVSDGIISNDSN
jgi:hypothetical protein